ncbi:MAG: heavy-metal-associated domain-containing protein [Anaerolineaceae bacterium]|nr:heavy-metal-associated domain-containing protein [Anaerolineaceae bacterium]
MMKVNYAIPAIHCNHCAMAIKVELDDVEGVTAVEVDVENKSATITYQAPATAVELIDVLKEIGYPAEI